MSLPKTFFLLIFILSLTTAFSQSKTKINKAAKKTIITDNDSSRKVAWLKENAVKIRSIDSLDEDFSDLMPLKKIIGDASVVMIGEPNHHIGTVYLAKTRLIKFLHQEMGFDLLAFESGMYDAAKTWKEIEEGKNTRQSFENAVFFANKEEYKPLINYIQKSLNTVSPLEIAGFDSQMMGRYSIDSLFIELKRFFSRFNYASSNFDDSSFFAKELSKANVINRYKSPDKTVIDTLSVLIKAIDSIATKPYDFETRYFLQLLKSIKREVQSKQLNGVLRSLSPEDQQRVLNLYFSIRDEQMADNLLWYVKQNPKRKIIVWAHNVHIMNDYPGDKTKQMWNDKPDAPLAPLANWENTYMGYIVKDSLKEKVFSITTVGNRGELGWINHTDSTKTFRVPIKQSTRRGNLGNLLNAAGFQWAFVNLKTPARGGEWLKGKLTVSAGEGFEAEWHKAADAILYVRDFTPTNIKD